MYSRGMKSEAKSSHDNNGRKISTRAIFNCTGADIDFASEAILDAIKTGTDLPEEIADLLTLTVVDGDDGIRGRINWS